MKWVDDVVLGAPWKVTEDLLTTMILSLHGWVDRSRCWAVISQNTWFWLGDIGGWILKCIYIYIYLFNHKLSEPWWFKLYIGDEILTHLCRDYSISHFWGARSQPGFHGSPPVNHVWQKSRIFSPSRLFFKGREFMGILESSKIEQWSVHPGWLGIGDEILPTFIGMIQ